MKNSENKQKRFQKEVREIAQELGEVMELEGKEVDDILNELFDPKLSRKSEFIFDLGVNYFSNHICNKCDYHYLYPNLIKRHKSLQKNISKFFKSL